MAVADFILVFAVLLPPLFTFIFVEREQQSEKAWTMLSYSTIVSALGKVLIIFTFNPFQMIFLATLHLVPVVKEYTLRARLKGRDIGKKGTPGGEIDIPEALGIVPGTIYLVCIICCQLYFGDTAQELVQYNAALLSICFMLFLGFSDDVLDLQWRYKLILPTIATLPLLCSYSGGTVVILPKFIGSMLVYKGELTLFGQLLNFFATVDIHGFGTMIDLGSFYLLYMSLLAVFTTNAINIYAGINGLEVGQAIVIACAILTNNLIEIATGSPGERANHLFSAVLIIPFIATSLGLLRYNWYPSSVFVGDTYCYFAGMTFAVVAILGHFSKTLLLFVIPQVFNFLYSLPQLLHIIPCPRHRLPKYNQQNGLLQPSVVPESGRPNLTLINLALGTFGPMHEKNLCILLLLIQVVSCGFGLFVRHYLAEILYR